MSPNANVFFQRNHETEVLNQNAKEIFDTSRMTPLGEKFLVPSSFAFKTFLHAT